MRALADIVHRLRSVLRRRVLEERLDEEIRFHVERQIEKNRHDGMAPDEARRQALIRFGGVEQMRERTRDEFRAGLIEHLARDVRSGLRSLRRHPAFAAMAVLSLAIGIGANATIFGVAHAVLFRASPLDNIETLVNVYESQAAREFNPMSHRNLDDLRAGTTGIFSGIAASTFAFAQVERGGTVSAVMGEGVTGGAFALLGIEPRLGRAIQPEDDVARGGHPVVMLSHGYWQRAFGGDPQVVGRSLQIGRRTYTIIGIAPADYRGGLPAITPAFYIPMAMVEEVMGIERLLERRNYHSFFVKARLAPGVTQAQAEHAASLVAASLTSARPEGWVPGEHFTLVPSAQVQVLPGVDPLLNVAAGLLMDEQRHPPLHHRRQRLGVGAREQRILAAIVEARRVADIVAYFEQRVLEHRIGGGAAASRGARAGFAIFHAGGAGGRPANPRHTRAHGPRSGRQVQLSIPFPQAAGRHPRRGRLRAGLL